MARINLLPWRDWERQRRRQEFIGQLLAGVVVAVLAVMLAGFSYDYRISKQQSRNKFLEEGIATLDKQIEEIHDLKERREQLLARMRVIQGLQGNRPVIVTAGLVCGADDPTLVTAAVARELAHLENRDVSHGVAEAVDWHAPLDLALGDVTRLREHMLDFADPKRSPGFTTEQETAASERALFMMTRVGVHLAAGQDLASLMARLRQLPVAAAEHGQPQHTAGKEGALDWEKVRAEACSLIGR